MTYKLSPDELPPPPPGSDTPLPEPGRRLRKVETVEIEGDLLCVHCAYNLRGLTKKHRCPECGTPAGFSLGGDRLKYAPVPWLKTVQNGLGLLLWSLAIAIASMLITSLAALLGAVSGCLALAGVLLLATPEPRAVSREAGFDLRKTICLLALINALCSVGMLLSPSTTLTSYLSFARLLLWCGLLLALAFFLKPLAGRAQDEDLERSTLRVTWGLALSLGALIVTTLLSLALGLLTSAISPVPCLAYLAVLLVCVFSGWFLILLCKYYGTIKWAAHDAQMEFEPPPVRELDLEYPEDS